MNIKNTLLMNKEKSPLQALFKQGKVFPFPFYNTITIHIIWNFNCVGIETDDNNFVSLV